MIAVEGDVTVPGLGLSPSDLRLLEDNVSVVFNLAATVRFDEELKDAVELNVNGPMRLLKVCRNMSRLKVRLYFRIASLVLYEVHALIKLPYSVLQALVHVSTAFNNLHRHTIDEVVYPGTLDPKVLIDFINGVDDREFINSITKQFDSFLSTLLMDACLLIIYYSQIDWRMPKHVHFYKRTGGTDYRKRTRDTSSCHCPPFHRHCIPERTLPRMD